MTVELGIYKAKCRLLAFRYVEPTVPRGIAREAAAEDAANIIRLETGRANFTLKLGHIGPKWDKSWTF